MRHPLLRLPSPSTTKLVVMFAALGVVFGLPARRAWASEIESQGQEQKICATIKTFTGEVQILDSTRTRVIDTEIGAAVPCGGWISVDVGWAELTHSDCRYLRVGTNSFVEIPLRRKDGGTGFDCHLVLYKGRVFAEANGQTGETIIITPNATIRQLSGKFLAIFGQTDEESQVIALSEPASLENRFEPSRRIEVRPGEATTLILGNNRILPSTPAAVMISSLKMTLLDLNFSEDEQREIIAIIRQRQDMKFASMAPPKTVPKFTISSSAPPIGRSPAADSKDGKVPQAGDAVSPDGGAGGSGPTSEIGKHWVSRLVGRDPASANEMLFPNVAGEGDEADGKGNSVKAKAASAAKKANEEKIASRSEKQKLLEALSRLRME